MEQYDREKEMGDRHKAQINLMAERYTDAAVDIAQAIADTVAKFEND